MALEIGEFIRRFLIHVLPKGFHRIRHDGLFASGYRAEMIARARELLGLAAPEAKAVKPDPAAVQALAALTPAAAGVGSASRPSRPAVSQAAGRPRLSSPSGSTPHERERHSPHPGRRRRSVLVIDRPRRCAARQRCPALLSTSLLAPRASVFGADAKSIGHTSRGNHPTAPLPRLASSLIATVKSP
jgi:hypothetical protein